MLPEPLIVVQILKTTLETLGIEYLIGGSIASSVHGIYRYTNDVDFVVDLKTQDVAGFVKALEGEFYVDSEMILDAIATQSSFNVIHLPTMVKADIFLFKPVALKQAEWARRRIYHLREDENQLDAYLATPEDMILQKLLWYRMGNGVSDQQWGDVQGMLKVQALALDFAYLQRWAAELDLSDLLRQSLEDAGLAEPFQVDSREEC